MKKKMIDIVKYLCETELDKCYVDLNRISRIVFPKDPNHLFIGLGAHTDTYYQLKNNPETITFLLKYFDIIDPDKEINKPIDDLELTCRSINCLRQMGIKTIKELLKYSAFDLTSQEGLGRKSLREIINVLKERDLYLNKETEK